MAKPELRDHRKFLKLKRLLGEPTPHVLGYLDCLWHRGYQTGSALVGDALDVEAAAEYPGDAGDFTKAAHAAGFLDLDGDGNYLIHDLFEHAPTYAKKRMRRRGTAPKSAHADTETEKSCPRGQQNDQNEAGRHTEPRTKNQEPRTESQEPRTKTLPSEGEEGAATVKRRFVPPTVEQVRDYCRERENTIDPERFVDFYASKGWRVGDQMMKDWKACVRTWEKSERSRDSPGGSNLMEQAAKNGSEFIRLTGGSQT